MKRFINIAKSTLLIALFAAATALSGCSADSIAGPEPQQQDTQGCDPCSNGHNL